MKIFKKTVLAAALLMGCTACGNTETNNTASAAVPKAAEDGALNIVTTIFPEYDWVKQIVGNTPANITLLLDNGVDLHSYQPTAEDILKISSCDMFIYAGGESDAWVEDALSEAVNENMKVIDLIGVLGDAAKEEELVEGMESEEDDGPEYDEHVWLSLKNAEVLCTEIAAELSELSPENADAYSANLETYTEQLNELDGRFAELAASARNKTLIFADRFPFRYFTDDYGLDYYAAFAGCSAETEASFETIAFLSQKADELGSDTIYTIEGSDGRTAQAVAANTAAKDMNTAVLDSMQSTTGSQADEGVTYLSVMENNYSVLKDTLK